MKRHAWILLFALLAIFLASSPVKAENLVIVLGLDESGSYNLRKQSLNMAKSIVSQMEGGDVLYVRRITEQSYLDEGSAVMRLELQPEPDKSKNIFDRKARIKRRKILLANAGTKRKAMAVIDGLKQMRAGQTDVWGFLSAAQERIQREKVKGGRMIIIASDMKDTVGRKSSLNLAGVTIKVVSFETQASPKATKKLRSRWKKDFETLGVEKVEFWPADMPVKIR